MLLFTHLITFSRCDLWQNGGEFLIIANTQKRQKVTEDCDATSVKHVEVNVLYLFICFLDIFSIFFLFFPPILFLYM